MITKKTFQEKITEANKVFTSTIEKLKTVKEEIAQKVALNNSEISKLQDENAELDALATNAHRQIEQISKFIN